MLGYVVHAQIMTTQQSFGSWLRGVRGSRQQRQKDVTAALRINRTTYSRWETEDDLPKKLEFILRLAAWSGVPRGEIFELIASDMADRAGAGEEV